MEERHDEIEVKKECGSDGDLNSKGSIVIGILAQCYLVQYYTVLLCVTIFSIIIDKH